MNLRSFVFRSIFHDFRMNTAIALGVMLATAVLTGALLVGDSMRGSLRSLTLERLGRVDMVLQSERFFSDSLLDEIDLISPWNEKAGGIYLPGAVQGGENRRTCGTNILGADDAFWHIFQTDDPPSGWGRNEIVVNRELARRLGLEKEGERISVRISKPETIPQESALGRRQETLIRSRLSVRKIIPDEGLGRFSLRANQKPEPLAILPLEWLQAPNRLDLEGNINFAVLATDSPESVSSENDRKKFAEKYFPKPQYLGIILDSFEDEFSHVKSERMMFSDPQTEAIRAVLPKKDVFPSLIYLAETIRSKKDETKTTPYSTVCATDYLSLGPNEAAINRWLANDLGLETEDEITVSYFRPESLHGHTVLENRTFKIARILEMESFALDSLIVPEMQGISDAKSLSAWDPPFPFDSRAIRRKDEDYWDEYKTAPKLYVNYDTGKEIWGSRFGNVTTFLLADGAKAEIGPETLDPGLFGMKFQPLKHLGLEASAGTTPFEVLFLSFGFFIIAAALMLCAMLMRLSIEEKAKRIGTMLACGFSEKRTKNTLLLEGGSIAFLGAFLGVPCGIAYAGLMIYGLQNWWVDAISSPFLELHVSVSSLIIGLLGGWILSLFVICISVRKAASVPVVRLLSGKFEDESGMFVRSKRNLDLRTILLFAIVAIMLSVFAFRFFFEKPSGGDETLRAGLFFGLGSLLLVMLLFWIYRVFKFTGRGQKPFGKLRDLAMANLARKPNRSALFIGLISATLFLVLSVSMFRLESESVQKSKNGGTGGFSLVMETGLPVFFDLNSEVGREELAIPEDEARSLDETKSYVYSFRVKPGDEAGCLNLYTPKNPRLLGAPGDFLDRGGFGFEQWNKLREPIRIDPDGVPRVSVVIEANTAMYSLHLYKGVGEVYELDDGSGRKVRCEVVGLLNGSILQGDIILGENNLLKLFPELAGYRFFLLESENPEKIGSMFFDVLADYGPSEETPIDRLGGFFAVQNTYISTFQSLGAIGLLLGSFGLLIIQLRNVIERRRELAMMQAIGFSRSKILLLSSLESGFLLGIGLIFAFCACMTAVPFEEARNIFTGRDTLAVLSLLIIIGMISNIASSLAIFRIPIASSLSEE